MESKKLVRSQSDRVIGGVCAGLGAYFNIDPVLVRLIFVLLALNGLGVMLYFILWLLVPDENSQEMSGDSLIRANVDDMKQQAKHFGSSFGGSSNGAVLVGVLLVALGAVFLLDNVFDWIKPGMLLPVVLIGIGVYLLFNRSR